MQVFFPRVDYTDLLCFLPEQPGQFLRNGSGVGICEGSCDSSYDGSCHGSEELV